VISGTCEFTGRVGDGEVDVGAVVRAPAQQYRPESGGPPRSGGINRPDRSRPAESRLGDDCSPILGCMGGAPRATSAPEAPVEVVPEVTIRDVASFAPEPPADEMEPGRGVAVRRMPANFMSRATEQVVGGTLLGRPAEVRFTPVGFAWDTGDGRRVESDGPGASWERLGQRELTDTATSHRYDARQTYTVQPTVTYAVEFRFDGSGWQALDETLDVAGPSYPVRVVTVETRLTRGSCRQFPDDPGCD
jgi:hypothetical protein